MRLESVTIQMYRNFVAAQIIPIEDDVTCLVGKNESGKTTILKALHRLNPANGSDLNFDLSVEYPRWRLARDRRANPNIAHVLPIQADFIPESDEIAKLEKILGVMVPPGSRVVASRSYTNEFSCRVRAGLKEIMEFAAEQTSVDAQDFEPLRDCRHLETAMTAAKESAKALREAAENSRAKAVRDFATSLGRFAFLADDASLTVEQIDAIRKMIPRFFYFSSYSVLPGECDLTALVANLTAGRPLSEGDQTVIALLAHAGEAPQNFMEADYNSRKAELQAASADLSRSAFEYWRQNSDLEVVFDTDNVVVGTDLRNNAVAHRLLKIELRDARHGNVETNFSTRSAGFQWFFSFFAAFSEYQNSKEPLVVLLDEPGTSLHGEAQKEFVRFIYDELGSSQQTLYTTHSQHMVDPARYEKIRAVHDRATREAPDEGVVVTRADFSTDRDTILPVEAALGYTISQHLFLGSGQHLAVEGSSDFVYLQRMTEYLTSRGRPGLDPRLSIIPVGGADNMPAFVALLGRRLKVSALIDGSSSSRKLARVKAAALHNNVDESHIVPVGEVSECLPTNADIEDLFDVADYLRLYNWTFGTTLDQSHLPSTTEPILKRLRDVVGEFDHALVAHSLSDHQTEFFEGMIETSAERFEKLFERLNGTVE